MTKNDPIGNSRTWRWIRGKHDPRWGATPEGYNPERVERSAVALERFFGAEGRYPVVAAGLENIPEGPCLFVSNHSGGSTVLDCLGLAFAWHSRFRGQRPLHFLAHEMLLVTAITGPFLHEVGALRASHKLAHEALGKWKRDVAVMPGGDQDTWRPFRDRYRVNFAGHTGYARVAMKAGVPIIPVAHAGPHSTLIVLTDGKRIARRLGLHDLFRIDVFPIHLSFPWGLGIGPWPHVPLPRPLHYRFGPPIHPPVPHEPGTEPDQEHVREYDREVQTQLQALLDEFAEESVLGRAWSGRRRAEWWRRRQRDTGSDEPLIVKPSEVSVEDLLAAE